MDIDRQILTSVGFNEPLHGRYLSEIRPASYCFLGICKFDELFGHLTGSIFLVDNIQFLTSILGRIFV